MAKSVPIRTPKQALSARQKARIEAFYQNAYETLRAVIDFKQFNSFAQLPRQGKVIRDVINIGNKRNKKYQTIKEPGYKFTKAQKSLLTKLATNKPTPEQIKKYPELKRANRRERSSLFNSADGVINKKYTLVKLNKKQKKFFELNEANLVTNKGLILKSQALKPKIKKLGKSYAITFSPPKTDGTEGRRKEIYIPIPDELYGYFGSIQAFMSRVHEIAQATNYTLAVRTYHGKTTIHPKLLMRYVQELHQSNNEAFEEENPFISGFYVITFKNVSPEKLVEQIDDDEQINDIINNPGLYDDIDF